MAEKMTSSDYLFEALLTQAVIEDCMRELESLPSEQELAKTLQYSPRHISRMKKMFSSDARREAVARFFSVAKKTASVAAVILVVIFGMLMLNPNVRAVVVDTIIEWFDTFTRFQSPQTAPVAFDTSLRPSYIPEGFVEEFADGDIEGESVMVVYRNDSDTIVLIYTPISASLSVNNENVAYRELTIDGELFYIFESTNMATGSNVVWESNGLRFSLFSMVSTDTLLLMAQSFSA